MKQKCPWCTNRDHIEFDRKQSSLYCVTYRFLFAKEMYITIKKSDSRVAKESIRNTICTDLQKAKEP